MIYSLDKNNIKIFKQAMVYFIIGGVTLVIALAWNTAFSNLIQKLFPNKSTNVIGHFLHAIILTLLFVVLSLSIVDPSYLSEFSVFRNSSKTENTKPLSSNATPTSAIVKTKD